MIDYDKIEALKVRATNFLEKVEIRPGDVLRWKPGLQNKNPDGPFIVLEVLPEPVLDLEDGPSSPHWREPLDLVLGFLSPGGDQFRIVYADRRRFRLLK